MRIEVTTAMATLALRECKKLSVSLYFCLEAFGQECDQGFNFCGFTVHNREWRKAAFVWVLQS